MAPSQTKVVGDVLKTTGKYYDKQMKDKDRTSTKWSQRETIRSISQEMPKSWRSWSTSASDRKFGDPPQPALLVGLKEGTAQKRIDCNC
jgi:hypothetical protein